MAVSVTLTVSNANSQRILNAIGYDPANDGDPVLFFKSWLAGFMRRQVMNYEKQAVDQSFNNSFTLDIT